jgi:CHASE3 domain sensor protein
MPHITSSLLRLGLASLGAGFLLLAGITLATIWFVHDEQDNRDASRQAVAIQMQLRRVETLLSDAETGHRGFLLTAYESYLEPYNRAISRIDAALETVRDGLAADGQQTRDLETLRRLTGEKLAELAATIKARREGDQANALEIVRGGTGKAFMDEARQTISSMVAAQNICSPSVGETPTMRAPGFSGAFLSAPS